MQHVLGVLHIPSIAVNALQRLGGYVVAVLPQLEDNGTQAGSAVKLPCLVAGDAVVLFEVPKDLTGLAGLHSLPPYGRP